MPSLGKAVSNRISFAPLPTNPEKQVFNPVLGGPCSPEAQRPHVEEKQETLTFQVECYPCYCCGVSAFSLKPENQHMA